MMSTRVLSNALRASSRNILRKNLIKSTIAIPRLASNFSTTPIKFNAKTQALHDVLVSEAEYEKADTFGLDETYLSYMKESNLEIIDTGDKVLAELQKKNGSETIHIYFDVQRITQAAYELRALEENMEDSEYMDKEELAESSLAEVNIVVEKQGKAVGFDMLLGISNNQFSVNGITNFSNASDALSETPEAANKRDLLYSGPAFTQLGEELQDSFNEYLASRGIDEQLGEFIIAYASVKENTDYITWLDKLEGFFK
ncbi:hypothetical protein CANARDRAFT_30988 [[Candida] arabinofermentans NRRL YB-2248]|uniref:Mitochondrial acidic protein MAM33 n=1 Tax=[Candida] arabinofermentans NRRL YB-2248 TaxID=983967 RepID=A0A1E4T7A1_9ASCO|nr:hypothetical protein CANARDRAFT_30988 [[Candida] arabinofermentans NRRL YB-2248]